MILIYTIVILMGGGLLAFLLGQWNKSLPRWIALCTVSVGFVVLVSFWIERYRAVNIHLSNTWMIDYRHDWIPSFGISFHLAIDGLSLLLLVLTFFLGILAVLCSWNEVKERAGFYHFNLLLDTGRNFRGIHGYGSVPVLLLLGDYAHPDVFPDWYMGK